MRIAVDHVRLDVECVLDQPVEDVDGLVQAARDEVAEQRDVLVRDVIAGSHLRNRAVAESGSPFDQSDVDIDSFAQTRFVPARLSSGRSIISPSSDALTPRARTFSEVSVFGHHFAFPVPVPG